MNELSTRERWLLDMARQCARFLDYRGDQDRVPLSRSLHAALMAYEDVEPCHDLDREDWRKRLADVKSPEPLV